MGNTNPTEVAYRSFPKAVLTRFVRIKPVNWETGISLRFEIYGCKITGKDYEEFTLFFVFKRMIIRTDPHFYLYSISVQLDKEREGWNRIQGWGE